MQVDPLGPSIQLVADFSTFFKIRSLVQDQLEATEPLSLMSCHLMTETTLVPILLWMHLRKQKYVERPRVRRLVPQWNLALVLESLMSLLMSLFLGLP